MILEIRRGDRKLEVQLNPAAGIRSVLIDGKEVRCDWLRLSDGCYSIILDGRVYDLAVESDGEACLVSGREGRHKFDVWDPRRLGSQLSAVEPGAGLQRLQAEMPGKIIRVLVRPGDVVARDQALLVLEAMKMQNEVRAPKTGTVREVAAVEGKTVTSGEFLLSLE